LRPKMGRRESERLYKGRNRRHLHPRIYSHQNHVLASPMDPIFMGEGSHEAMKEGG
jgi:hypothetical protein